MKRVPTLLLDLPWAWKNIGETTVLGNGEVRLIREGEDYDPAEIDYVFGFRQKPGFLQSLPNLKAVFSMAAGIDGFLKNGDYPADIPLFRFCDETLSAEMAQYLLLMVLSFHRQQVHFAISQQRHEWNAIRLPRRTQDTRIGIFGMGTIGGFAAPFFVNLGFQVNGWSRTPKNIPGVTSYAGAEAREAFLNNTDILINLLPMTPDTKGILNAETFAALPDDAYVINVARGGHLIVDDLIAALDSGHLAGACLDVFEKEPLPEDSPLWAHPKVSVTPHIASVSQLDVSAAQVLAGIEKMERGEMPDNRVDVARGY